MIFSDQVFLVETRRMAKPIFQYHNFHVYSYPLANIAPTFEARISSFMRCNNLLRVFIKGTTFTHAAPVGTLYPNKSQSYLLTFKLITYLLLIYHIFYDNIHNHYYSFKELILNSRKNLRKMLDLIKSGKLSQRV